MARPRGRKDWKTIVTDRVLDQVAKDGQERRRLESYFRGCALKPPGFWKRIADITSMIQEQLDLQKDKDAVVIVALDGSNVASWATPELATVRISEQTHRLGTEADLRGGGR